MNTRRMLTPKEQEALVIQLEELRSSIHDSYEYPLNNLIDNLKDPEQNKDNEVEENNGHALRYYLHFSSPAITWRMLCGRAGIYTVVAASLKAIDFELTCLN